MVRSRFHPIRPLFCFFFLSLTVTLIAQRPSPPAPSTQSHAAATEPAATLRTFSRMVTLEVVVKDRRGHHVTGLKPADFGLFEQTPGKGNQKREQKIAAFHEVSVAGLARNAAPEAAPQPGVYTNAVAARKDPIPPTIILMDGLNTETEYQAQVHAQSVKMLAQLPGDAPVAVFLLGFKLEMVQDFTSDPSMLQAAVKKAISTAGHDFAQVDPRDDPYLPENSSSVTGPSTGDTRSTKAAGPAPDLSGPWQDMFRELDHFYTAIYRGQMEVRVRLTSDALVAIAQHMSGYPGRKNLLWISTAFPICLDPAMDSIREHVYNRQIERVANALSDAKVAVYPINPAGVRTPGVSTFNASSPAPPITKAQLVYALNRQAEGESRELDTMQLMADGTGGEVCTGDNDIADCVHRTVDDSSHFYEIAYYPNAKDWNGEYRKIILNAKNKDWHLEYRQGYFATPQEAEKPTDVRDALKHAACAGPLDATSILIAAKSLPPDSPDGLKFNLEIGARTLTFTPTGDGGSEVNLQLAVCTFDRKGNPGQFMSIPLNRKLDEKEAQRAATTGLEDVAAIPGPRPASLRLAVMDIPSGRLGSISIKTDGLAAATQASAN